MGFYNLKTKTYKWKKAEAELEIDGITGNVALLDGIVRTFLAAAAGKIRTKT